MARTLLYRVSSTGVRTPALDVDVVLTAGTSVEVQLTDNPVEDGADITDHQVDRPRSHEVTAIVTDRPMSGAHMPGRALAAWQTLNELKASQEMLIVVLPLVGEQVSARLTRFSSDFTVEVGQEALRFTASLREVRVATSQRVPAQKRRESKLKPNMELGDKSGTPADAATAGKSKTTLKELKDTKTVKKAIDAFLGAIGSG